MAIGQDFLDAVQPKKQDGIGEDFLQAVQPPQKGIGQDFLSAVGSQPAAPPVPAKPTVMGEVGRGMKRAGLSLAAVPGAMLQQAGETPVSQMGGPMMMLPGNKQVAEFAEKGFRKVAPGMMNTIDLVRQRVADAGKAASSFFSNKLEAPQNQFVATWKDNPGARAAGVIAEAAPMYAAALALTAATKSPTAAAALFGATQGSKTYQDARQAGATPEAASILARADAAWTALSERIPFDQMLKASGPVLQRMLKGATTETVQEFIQGLGSDLIAKFGYDEDRAVMTMDKFLDTLVGSAALGGVGGAVLGQPATPEQTPLARENAQKLAALDQTERTLIESSAQAAKLTDMQMAEVLAKDTFEERQAAIDQIIETSQPRQPDAEAQPATSPAGTQADAPVADLTEAQASLDTLKTQIETTRGIQLPPLVATEKPADRGADADAAERFGSLIGKRVVWFRGEQDIPFNGTVDDTTIYIRADGKPSLVRTAVHEAVHTMRRDAPELYGQLLAVVKQEGSGFDQYRQRLLADYQKQRLEVDQNDDWVWEELVAEVTGDRGTDATFWQDLYAKAPEAVQRFVDTIKQLIDRVRGQLDVDPTLKPIFDNFQRVHDTAVDVLAQYAATRPAAPTTPQTPPQAVEAGSAAAIQPTTTTEAPNAQQETLQAETALTETGIELSASQIERADYATLKEAAKANKIGSLSVWDATGDRSAEALRRELLKHRQMSLKEQGRQENVATAPAMTREEQASAAADNRVQGEVEVQAVERAKRGEFVPDDVWDSLPPKVAKQWKGYALTKENPAKIEGIEAYHDGDRWMIRAPGAKDFRATKNQAAIAKLNEALPGAVESAPPFAINRDKTLAEIIAEEDMETGKTAKALLKKGTQSDVGRRVNESLKYLPKPRLQSDREAQEWIDEQQDVVKARNALMAGDHKLDPDAEIVAALRIENAYDRAARDAEKAGDRETAEAIYDAYQPFAEFRAEQQRKYGRAASAIVGMVKGWDTLSGITSAAKQMFQQANEGNKDTKNAERDRRTVAEAVREAEQFMEQVVVEELRQKIAAKEAELAKMQRQVEGREGQIQALVAERAALKERLAAQDRFGKALLDQAAKDKTPFVETAKTIKKQKQAGLDAINALLKTNAFAIEKDSDATVPEAKVMPEQAYDGIVRATSGWIAEQTAAGNKVSFNEWATWIEKALPKDAIARLKKYDNFNEAFESGRNEWARQHTELSTGKRARTTDAQIRRTLREMGSPLEKLILEHYSVKQEVGKSLVAKLREAGMGGKDALAFAKEIQQRMNKMLDTKARQVLERKLAQKKPITRAQKNIIDDIIKTIKLGGLTEQGLADLVSAKYGLAVMTPEIRAKLAEFVGKIADAQQAASEALQKEGGFSKEQADEMAANANSVLEIKQDAARYMVQNVKTNKGDMFWAYVHFSLLSGPITQLFNTASNNAATALTVINRGVQSLGKGVAKGIVTREALNEFRVFGNALAAMVRGIPMGLSEARHAWKTGYAPLKANEKFESDPKQANPFDTSKTLAKIPALRAFLNYPRRALMAADVASALPLREFQSAFMAAAIAQREGLAGKPLMRRVSEIMGYERLNRGELERIAKAEGLTGDALKRRTLQLMEQLRPAQVREQAAVFSQWETFNFQTPHGPIGSFAMRISEIGQKFPIMKPLGLFMRVSANVSNNTLDYTYMGLIRAVKGKVTLSSGKTVELDDIYEGARADVLTKAIVGNGVAALILIQALQALKEWEDDPDKDKKEPWFTITAAGPMNPVTKEAWRAAGGRPYSFRWGNGRPMSYRWLGPLGGVLAVAGMTMDRQRWHPEDEDEESFTARLAIASTYGLGRYILDNSPVATLNSVLKVFNESNDKIQERAFGNLVSGFSGYAWPKLFEQIDKFIDPTVYRGEDLWHELVRNIAVVRATALQPALNIFGDKVEYPPSERFFGPLVDDPEMQFLVSNDIGLAKPRRFEVFDPDGTQRDITETEYRRFIEVFGPKFREQLRLMIPRLSTTPPEYKKDAVAKMKSDVERYARDMVKWEVWNGRQWGTE